MKKEYNRLNERSLVKQCIGRRLLQVYTMTKKQRSKLLNIYHASQGKSYNKAKKERIWLGKESD